MNNKKIAEIFEEMGNILEIKGDLPFRVNAYKKAAMLIENLPVDLRDMVLQNPDDIKQISGIGDRLKDKIVELVLTGHLRAHAKLKKGFPNGLLDMLKIRGIGPKKVKLFYSKLGITTLANLKNVAEKHKLQELEGMGEKSEQDILEALEDYALFPKERTLLNIAMREADRLIEYMKLSKFIKKIEFAGSLRRFKETIGDIDILATVKTPENSCDELMEHFVNTPGVIKVIAKGDTKSSVILENGMQVDLRVIADESFGAALHYFTGNKAHNIKIRELAKKNGLKVNEYGVFKRNKPLVCKSEKDVFHAVALPYIIPELRRDEGEIEYGFKHKKFPRFIEEKDIRGDLHIHTKYSDGKNSVEEMARACIDKGYEYMAITDHSSLVGITGGMGSKDIRKQSLEIDKVNSTLKGKIKILKGVEVDIRKDGSLDFENAVLKELDIVIASVHLYHRMPLIAQTKRIIAAIENPYVKILAHPTTRLINKRPEIKADFEKIFRACVENKVALEINSNPQRLDLMDKYIRIAKDLGAKFVINTDAHGANSLDYMKFGVGMARRGWLTKSDVLNSNTVLKFDN